MAEPTLWATLDHWLDGLPEGVQAGARQLFAFAGTVFGLRGQGQHWLAAAVEAMPGLMELAQAALLSVVEEPTRVAGLLRRMTPMATQLFDTLVAWSPSEEQVQAWLELASERVVDLVDPLQPMSEARFEEVLTQLERAVGILIDLATDFRR